MSKLEQTKKTVADVNNQFKDPVRSLSLTLIARHLRFVCYSPAHIPTLCASPVLVCLPLWCLSASVVRVRDSGRVRERVGVPEKGISFRHTT